MLECGGKLNHLVKIVAHLIHGDKKSRVRFREGVKELAHANAPRGSRLQRIGELHLGDIAQLQARQLRRCARIYQMGTRSMSLLNDFLKHPWKRRHVNRHPALRLGRIGEVGEQRRLPRAACTRDDRCEVRVAHTFLQSCKQLTGDVLATRHKRRHNSEGRGKGIARHHHSLTSFATFASFAIFASFAKSDKRRCRINHPASPHLQRHCSQRL